MERRSEGAVFATSILLLDGWMMVEMRPQAVARREKPSCDRIGVARVFASTSTHARTHVHSSYKHRGVVHELLRVPSSTDLFFFFFFSPFFFHAPSSFFRTPRRIVQFTVPIRPWITFVHVETGFIEVVESFPMLLQPDDTALNNATIFNVAFSPLFIFLPFFLSRN